MAVDAPQGPGSGSSNRLGVPSRNPLPLSASQEAQVRDVFHARVRRQCGPEIKAFAECALGRTFSIPFVCREQHRLMNSCMKKHSTTEELDAAREEWFAGRLERQQEREKKTRRKLEQEKFIREWWNMPDMDPERLKREMAKLDIEERIGGQVSKSRRRFDENPSEKK